MTEASSLLAARTTGAPWVSRAFIATCAVIGLVLFVWAATAVDLRGGELPSATLLAVPLIVLIARFPMLIDAGGDGIEVGFDSAVLMFLVCTLPAPAALLTWSAGVLCTQLVSGKRREAQVFNVGVGIIAGALATGVLHLVRGEGISGPQELLAVALSAAVYFSVDFLVSAVFLSLDSDTSFRDHLMPANASLAIACFVPFDTLGYLGAVMLRRTEWWTLVLLAVPLVTLLVATRAVTRGRENARRLQVLLDAAVDTQTLADPRQVIESLVEDAQKLLRLQGLEVAPREPGPDEVGAQVRAGEHPLWIVAPARHRARSTTDADEQALRALAAVSSASFARLALTDDLVHLARYDPLTDLPNRAVFLDRLHFALQLARRRKHHVALLFIDLDGFKPVNDRFGHAAGDAVLVEVAQRLQARVREIDTVARLGGDEFAVLLDGIDLERAEAICERILTALVSGVETADHLVTVSASIGLAVGSGDQRANDLLRDADLAMYEAKARGKNRFVRYEPWMLAARLDRLELVDALERALDSGDLTLVYQPIVVVETGRIVGVEALVRWRNGSVDVRPDVFIEAAEKNGLISAIGDTVLEQVARHSAEIQRAAGGEINIAVNVSPTQLTEPDFVETVRRTVGNLSGASLILEITERERISRDATVLQTMQTISEMGVVFAIDDFGVGFSSISYLQEVPARIVKVDASLVRKIDTDVQARDLLRSISSMSQALGFDVVIEGIERESQMATVRDDVAGAFAQGFLLHRPMPMAQLLEALRQNRIHTSPW